IFMRQCKTDNERDQRREALGQAMSDITTATKKGQSLADFLDRTTLDAEKEDTDLEKKSGVTLITLHASKGLEFPVVFLVGLEQGILPHKRSLEEGTTDEERRLLYVGITRAQKKLHLTRCAYRTKWGEATWCEPSTFLKELDPEWLSEEDYEELMNQPVSQEEISSALSAFLDED
ncbi:MAG: 3'-5' exonuclease, partial [Verrucomicrobiales bacterium]